MIKFLKNQDIQITKFSIAKSKNANDFFPDLILANDENSNFPLILPVETCNYNFNSSNVSNSFATIVDSCNSTLYNESGYLAASPIDNENNPDFQIGRKYESSIPFYPVGNKNYDSTINPINKDGTYQGQVYNRVKNMYYNNYNNSYNIFGLDGYNTQNIKLNLQNKFTLYSFNVTQSGDQIRPFSVNINNQTGDIVAYIKDDGDYNLYLSGSYFVNNFEFYANTTSSIENYCETGLAKYICTGQFNTC